MIHLTGGCHCGAVRFSAKLPDAPVPALDHPGVRSGRLVPTRKKAVVSGKIRAARAGLTHWADLWLKPVLAADLHCRMGGSDFSRHQAQS